MFKLEIDESERLTLQMSLRERIRLMEQLQLPLKVEECKTLLEKLTKLQSE